MKPLSQTWPMRASSFADMVIRMMQPAAAPAQETLCANGGSPRARRTQRGVLVPLKATKCNDGTRVVTGAHHLKSGLSSVVDESRRRPGRRVVHATTVKRAVGARVG